MEITSRELRDAEIEGAVRGYNRDVVNEMLERAAVTLDAANERVRQLGERLASVQTEAGRSRETEDILHRTLVLAQRAADEAVAEAQAKARQMVDEADIQSRRTLAEAEAEGRRRGESERRRLEEEVLDLASRRDALLADVEAFSRFEAEYRERMQRALEADLAALRNRPTAAPGPRPEISDVEVPAASEPARGENPTPAAPAPPAFASPPAMPPTPAPTPAPGVGLSAPPASPAYGGAPAAPAITPTPPPAPEASAARADVAPAPPDPPTSEVDMRTLFEERSPATTNGTPANAPEPALTATEAPIRDDPIDLLSEDALGGEVLDDDAFFATLREAVHDDSPLGPREDDDDPTFFETEDDDRSSFRDVFRRRR